LDGGAEQRAGGHGHRQEYAENGGGEECGERDGEDVYKRQPLA